MGRAPRPLAPGLTYHVAARGNNGRSIYVGTADRRFFLRMLGRIASRRDWSVAGYCLMDNHFHLLVTTATADLSDGMRELLSGYARHFNRKRGRTGHLFSARYLSVVVTSDRQLLAAAKYIARNPVRAGLRRSPREWEWSSYSRLALGAPLPQWCSFDVLLDQFHLDRTQALVSYLMFVEDDRLDVTDEVSPGAVEPVARRVPSVSVLLLLMPANDAIVAAVELGFTHQEIADSLGLSVAAVGQRIYRHRVGRAAGNGGIAERGSALS